MHKVPALFILTLLAASAGAADLEPARNLYQRTEYDAALKLLNSLETSDGPALALAGKAHYGKGEFKKASEALEQAVAASPHNSDYWSWLGKAFGKRADTSSFITAPRYASKCRRAFERAVELDPNNPEAVNDLFSYYLEAPGFLGGGLDRAGALAERIGELDRAEYHWAQAQLARKRKQFTSAETHLRKAMDLAPNQVGRVIDLAAFLAGRGRAQESDAVFRKARELAPEAPKVLFARAGAYIEADREPEAARKLLEQYLSSDLTPEDPPRQEAEKLLRRIGK